MHKEDPNSPSPEKLAPKLTLKQSRFAAAYADPTAANGNGVAACRIAGYSGNPNALAVQASANLRNPTIRQSIAEALDAQGCTLERAALAVAEAMQATKRRSFLDKDGTIIYGDAEPDHRPRLHAAAMRFHFQTGETFHEQAGGAGHQADPAAPKAEVGELDQLGEPGPDELGQLDPADRLLFEQATKLEAELAELDRELNDGGGGHGSDQ